MDELGKFGLPVSPFDPMSEPESERSERIAAVKALVLEVFNVTKVHLGEEEARKLFVKTTHRKKGKRAAEKVNSKLLEFYDAVVARNPEKASSAPRQIAERLCKLGQAQYGGIRAGYHKENRPPTDGQRGNGNSRTGEMGG